mmetsp:Transcript_16999/g.36625  ORF Transcript_16999/g.36625 Transcript_16999/m.36625 type:complete len:208 (+) Transcript_16999:598-1221(+)
MVQRDWGRILVLRWGEVGHISLMSILFHLLAQCAILLLYFGHLFQKLLVLGLSFDHHPSHGVLEMLCRGGRCDRGGVPQIQLLGLSDGSARRRSDSVASLLAGGHRQGASSLRGGLRADGLPPSLLVHGLPLLLHLSHELAALLRHLLHHLLALLFEEILSLLFLFFLCSLCFLLGRLQFRCCFFLPAFLVQLELFLCFLGFACRFR